MEGKRGVVQVAAVPQHRNALQKSPTIHRTLQEYKDVSEYCKTQLADADPTGLSKGSRDLIPWLIRSHVFATLRSMGIPALELDDTKVSDIVGCFPDANGWLIELTSARHLATVSDVCEYLGIAARLNC